MKKVFIAFLFLFPAFSFASETIWYDFPIASSNRISNALYQGPDAEGFDWWDIIFHATTTVRVDFIDIYGLEINHSIYEVFQHTEAPVIHLTLYRGTGTTSPAVVADAYPEIGYDAYMLNPDPEGSCPTVSSYTAEYCTVRFYFPVAVTLTEGDYTFAIRPIVEGDYINMSILMTSTNAPTEIDGVRLESDWEDFSFSYRGVYLRLGFSGALGDPVISLTEPCVTDSNDLNYCEYGTAETGTSLVPVRGVATPNMTYINGYDILATLTQDYRTIDYQRIYGGYSSQEEFDVFLDFGTSTTQLAELSVCMVPANSWDPVDTYMCADAWIGSELTTASTTSLVEELNLGTRDTPFTDRSIADTTTVGDRLMDDIVNSLVGYFDTIRYAWPFGYLSLVYDEYEDQRKAYVASSTVFAMTLKPEDFNLPAASTPVTLDIGAMAASAGTMSPELFEMVDLILWGLFALFLVFRIARGTWEHGLEYGSSVTKREWNDAWKTGEGSIKMASYLTGNYRRR